MEVRPVPPLVMARVPEMVERVEVAPEYSLPRESTPTPPAEREVRYVLPELVSWVVEAYVAKVEEAMSPYPEDGLIQRPVVVELLATPLYESGVNGKTPVALMVRFVPPMRYPGVPVKETPVPAVREEVATPATPAPPVPYRMWDWVMLEVVARPVYVIEELVPPTVAPVTLPMNGPLKASEVVATSTSALPSSFE